MGNLIFGCGCQFPIADHEHDIYADHHTGPLPVGIDVDIYNVPHTCPRTWALLAEGHTKGVFQLEGNLGRTWARKIQPENLEELSALIALIRPGCLNVLSGNPPKSMTKRFKDRKHKLEDIEYLHPALEPILEKTYGILVYQESAMQLAVTLAGFSLQQSDVLRKSIGKKRADIMSKVRDEFISGCTTTAIVTTEQAEEIFGWVQESQRYSFNKSHAVSYAEGGYWTAYLKAHFPAQFYCSFLHGAQWKQDTGEEVYELVNDAKLNDIVVRVPDFRDQQTVPYLHGNEVCFGIGDIKNVGVAALQKLRTAVADIDKPVSEWSWMDYVVLFSDRVSSTVNEALVCSGALDYYEKPRTTMMYELNLWKELTKKEQEWIAEHGPHENLITALQQCARTKKEGGGCHGVKRVVAVENLATMLEKPPHSLYDTADFIAWCEDKYLGASLTCSRVDGCVKAVEANVTCKDVVRGHTGYTVVAVEVTRVKQVKTKKGKTPGQNMAFMSVADSSCSLDDVVVFPSVWREYQDLLYEGNTVLLQGEPSRKKGGGFTAKKFWQI